MIKNVKTYPGRSKHLKYMRFLFALNKTFLKSFQLYESGIEKVLKLHFKMAFCRGRALILKF